MAEYKARLVAMGQDPFLCGSGCLENIPSTLDLLIDSHPSWMGEVNDHYPQLLPADQYPRCKILGGLHFFIFYGKKMGRWQQYSY